jgi:hypothetical protein
MGKTSTERSRDRRARLAGFSDYDDLLEDKHLQKLSAELNASAGSDRERQIILERDRKARIERMEATHNGLLVLGETPASPKPAETIEEQVAAAIFWHKLLGLGPVPQGRTLMEEIETLTDAWILAGRALWNPLSGEWSPNWVFDIERRNRQLLKDNKWEWFWCPGCLTHVLDPKDFEYKSPVETQTEALAQ